MGAEIEKVTIAIWPLWRARVFFDDDASEAVTVYFETQAEAERFLSRLPEATR